MHAARPPFLGVLTPGSWGTSCTPSRQAGVSRYAAGEHEGMDVSTRHRPRAGRPRDWHAHRAAGVKYLPILSALGAPASYALPSRLDALAVGGAKLRVIVWLAAVEGRRW
jgi:hypothetical protein